MNLLEPANHSNTKEQIIINLPEKEFIGSFPFEKSCMAAACKFILNKLLRTLALRFCQSMQLDQHSVS